MTSADRILSLDRLQNGVAITFGDDRSFFFAVDALYRMRDLGVELKDPDGDEPEEIPY